MAYSKLYSSIVHSSLWTEPDHIRLLFITMLAIADREGYVYASKNGLYRLANLNAGWCEEIDPLEALMMPDEDSSDLLRNPENEGKRVEAVPGGFRILNFLYYRGLRNEDDRRQQNREAQRRHREKVSHSQPRSSKVTQHKPISEEEEEAAPAPKKKTPIVPLKGDGVVEEIYEAYPRKVGKPAALRAIRRALKTIKPDLLLHRTQAYAKCRGGEESQFTPHPATWFNGERYNDDPSTWKSPTLHNNESGEIWDKLGPQLRAMRSQELQNLRIKLIQARNQGLEEPARSKARDRLVEIKEILKSRGIEYAASL